MSDSRMVDAVNRLVSDLLAGVGEVFLPGIGSLYVERHAAKRVSKRSILPPSRTVTFSSQQCGASLVDEIAAAAQVDGAKATEIYETWLARVRNENVLTVEGVGVLKFKTFVLAPEFDRVLNPLGHAPMSVKPVRRFDWAMWTGIAAILFAAGFGGYQFLMTYPDEAAVADRVSTAPAASGADVVSDAAVPADSATAYPADASAGKMLPIVGRDTTADGGTSAADAAAMTSEPAAAGASFHAANPASAANPAAATTASGDAPADAREPLPASASDADDGAVSVSQRGMHYVVLGVYSTPENARRAVAEGRRKAPRAAFRIYRFGEKFLVSPFEAPDAADCSGFIRAHEDVFPGMWTYTRR